MNFGIYKLVCVFALLSLVSLAICEVHAGAVEKPKTLSLKELKDKVSELVQNTKTNLQSAWSQLSGAEQDGDHLMVAALNQVRRFKRKLTREIGPEEVKKQRALKVQQEEKEKKPVEKRRSLWSSPGSGWDNVGKLTDDDDDEGIEDDDEDDVFGSDDDEDEDEVVNDDDIFGDDDDDDDDDVFGDDDEDEVTTPAPTTRKPITKKSASKGKAVHKKRPKKAEPSYESFFSKARREIGLNDRVHNSGPEPKNAAERRARAFKSAKKRTNELIRTLFMKDLQELAELLLLAYLKGGAAQSAMITSVAMRIQLKIIRYVVGVFFDMLSCFPTQIPDELGSEYKEPLPDVVENTEDTIGMNPFFSPFE